MGIVDNTHIHKILLLLAAALAALFLYGVSLEGQFVLDDTNNIENNSSIRITRLTAAALHDAAFKSVLSTRPVANISFALNHYIHGYNVRGFHLVNILLHIITGILLYFFVTAFLDLPQVRHTLGPPGWVPLVTAIIWMLHPVQTQTVNYIVQRMTILAALFYILAFFLFIKGRTATNTVHRWIFYGGTLLAALLGLGSKETVAMLPFFLLLFDWYFIRDAGKPLPRKFIASSLILLLIACLLVFFYLGKNPRAYITASFSGRDFTLEQRLLTQSRVVLFYLSLIFLPLPSRLNLEHDFQLSTALLAPPATFFALALIIILLGIALTRAKRHPILSFCLLWYFGNLVIESSVIGLEIIFEHRVYLPSMLLILFSVLWIRKILPQQWLRLLAVAAILPCLMFWTYERNTVWADSVSLLADSVSKSPDKHRAHLNLGIALKNQGRVDEAVSHYRKVIELKPDYAEGYYNMGNGLLILGDFKGAAENYFKALTLTPADVDTHYNLGYTLSRLWRFDEAAYHYSVAIRLKPDFMEARRDLAELKRYMQRLNKKKKSAE